MSAPSGRELLDRVIPFRFLSSGVRAALAERLEQRQFRAGEVIVRRGERSRDVFLLAEGEVEAVDESTPPRVISLIVAGHYFGERAALFEGPRRITIRASARGPVVAYALPGQELLRLVEREPVFAQALASTLKVKQGVFLSYQNLYARLLGLLSRREFLLSDLLPAYRDLHPALHPGMREERIDVGALGYAIARLPQDVTRTCYYYLTGELSVLYPDPDQVFVPVATKARRRAAWQPVPGKMIVLLRDGVSDVTDFLTNLCLFAVEARKIRHRIRSSDNLRLLSELSARPEPGSDAQLGPALGLSEDELSGLRRVWPDDLPARLRDLIVLHEDIAMECDQQLDNYNSRAAEVWVAQIRDRAAELVDLNDPELQVHIISSNTHSVSNCLSSYLGRRREEILLWGRERFPELVGACPVERPWGECWRDPRDLVYVLTRRWLREVPGAHATREAEDRAAGQVHLDSTAFTGIEVDLIDLTRIDPELCDPAVGPRRPGKPTLLVNIDYAFGQQAEEILSNLLFEFGHRVRSVNVLGKAGGLTGHRGDLLLPRATLLQTNDELYPLPNQDLSVEVLRELIPDRVVHEGPVLTVAGTLLQDRVLLYFYKRIWKCVGLEMEGSFFARQLTSAIETGVVRPDVRSRFVYYVSDIPLETEQTLSEGLAAWEGVPPLYAVTRAVLRRIFEQD